MTRVAIFGAAIFEGRREADLFKKRDWEATYFEDADPLDRVGDLQDVEGIIVNLQPVSAALMDALPRIRVIGRYGVGVDNIDIAAATERGLAVINVPDYCIDEVAEHAVSFIFAANRKLMPAAQLTRRGEWGNVSALKPMKSIKDITLGVVGTGRIGMQVIRMIAPFGSRILIYDPYLNKAELPSNAESSDLEGLLAQSDIITIHCPLNAQTRHMFNREAFAKMKRKPAIVNVSRGPIIRESDLLEALEDGTVSYAALDVLESEPPSLGHPLLSHDKALVTNHLAWYSEQSERKLRDLVASRVIDYLSGLPVPTIVNPVGGFK